MHQCILEKGAVKYDQLFVFFLQVGPLTTPLVTQCLCNHLTFFGSSFFVMPNLVDVSRTAELFATFTNNPVVVCFVGAIFVAYLLVVVWARRKDIQDSAKVIPIKTLTLTLRCNSDLPTHTYNMKYSVSVPQHNNPLKSFYYVTCSIPGYVSSRPDYSLTVVQIL